MNHCVFAGRLTRDPESRQLKDGTSVTNFSLALNRKYKNKNTQQFEEEVNFLDFESWAGAADTIANYCKKGDYIQVVASAKNDNWTDAEGNKRSRVRFRVKEFYFVPGGKNNNTEEPTKGKSRSRKVAAVVNDDELGVEDDDSSIPF